MIANLSPGVICFEDTYNTLNYANRAKNIKTNASRNVLNVSNHIANYGQVINSLKQENDELKKLLANLSIFFFRFLKIIFFFFRYFKILEENNTPSQGLSSKSDNVGLEKLENEIKSHFEEEKDLKSKIQSTDLKIEEAKSSILNSLEKGGSENVESKKMNLQLLQKAKEDLVSQYNTLLSKRNALKNVFVSNS